MPVLGFARLPGRGAACPGSLRPARGCHSPGASGLPDMLLEAQGSYCAFTKATVLWASSFGAAVLIPSGHRVAKKQTTPPPPMESARTCDPGSRRCTKYLVHSDRGVSHPSALDSHLPHPRGEGRRSFPCGISSSVYLWTRESS